MTTMTTEYTIRFWMSPLPPATWLELLALELMEGGVGILAHGLGQDEQLVPLFRQPLHKGRAPHLVRGAAYHVEDELLLILCPLKARQGWPAYRCYLRT